MMRRANINPSDAALFVPLGAASAWVLWASINYGGIPLFAVALLILLYGVFFTIRFKSTAPSRVRLAEGALLGVTVLAAGRLGAELRLHLWQHVVLSGLAAGGVVLLLTKFGRYRRSL